MTFKMKGYSYPGKSPLKSHKKGHPAPKKEQQGPIAERNMDLKPSEMEGTWVYKGKDKGEQVIDYADRAEFAREDAFNSEGKKKAKHLKAAKDLERESEIIRIQRNKNVAKKQASKKKPPFKYHKKGHKEGDNYEKRKEALLNKGFTQEDADWQIKHGGDVKPTKKDTKPTRKVTGKIVYKNGKKYWKAPDGSLHTGQVSDYEQEKGK